MQALGQPGCAELRIDLSSDECFGFCRAQPGEGHPARAGFATQALDQLCEPFVAVDILVTIGIDHEHRTLRGATREVLKHLRGGVVGPLDVVDHQNIRTPASRRLEQLVHRTGQACLPCLGEIVRQRGQARRSFGHLGNQGGDFRERHGRQISQRSIRHAVERARDEVDHGLVWRRAFDLVAVRRECRHVPGVRVAGDLAHQPALANPRFAFDQNGLSDAGGEPRDESDEHAELVASADEWRGVARGADGRIGQTMDSRDGRNGARVGADRRGIQRQTVCSAHRTCRVEKIAPLLLGNSERRGEPFS